MFTVHESNSLTQEVFEVLTGKAIPKRPLYAELPAILAWPNVRQHEAGHAEAIHGDHGLLQDAHWTRRKRGPLLSEMRSDQFALT